jgi:hypothetical protein
MPESFQQDATGDKHVFVPACDRFAVVPDSGEPDEVPDVPPTEIGSTPKRTRID